MAAGASIPKEYATGSGIYSGRFGAMKSFIADTAMTKVIISKIPKLPGTPIPVVPSKHRSELRSDALTAPETLNVIRSDLSDHEIKWLNFGENTTQIGRACHGEVCCLYNITVSMSPGEAPQTVGLIFNGTNFCFFSHFDSYICFSKKNSSHSIHTLLALLMVHVQRKIHILIELLYSG